MRLRAVEIKSPNMATMSNANSNSSKNSNKKGRNGVTEGERGGGVRAHAFVYSRISLAPKNMKNRFDEYFFIFIYYILLI
jgi:hypothetical protein